MHATTVAIDLAKEVFELAFADAAGRIVERKRLKRGSFAECLANRQTLRVVMEACGSAHAWARRLQRLGHAVELLGAQHVRAYVRRNKTAPRLWAAEHHGARLDPHHLSERPAG